MKLLSNTCEKTKENWKDGAKFPGFSKYSKKWVEFYPANKFGFSVLSLISFVIKKLDSHLCVLNFHLSLLIRNERLQVVTRSVTPPNLI